MSTRDKPCSERVAGELESTLETLNDLWKLHCEDSEAYHEEHGTNMYEYGLGFDYVAAGTFPDQKRGYFRYQISWGGPSDEFRFYADMEREPYSIEYWFMDWFDGARIQLNQSKPDHKVLWEIWHWFDDMGSVERELEEAREEAY